MHKRRQNTDSYKSFHFVKILKQLGNLYEPRCSVHMVVSRTSKHTWTHQDTFCDINISKVWGTACLFPRRELRLGNALTMSSSIIPYVTGGPRRELSYSSCMYETNTVPIIRSQVSLLMWSISKARLCSSQPGKRERELGRERLTHCSHHEDDWGPLKLEQHQ